MRTFILYIICRYTMLIGLISGISLFICHPTNTGIKFEVVATVSLYIIPLWLLLSFFSRMTFFDVYLGYSPISVKQIKKKIAKQNEHMLISFCSVWRLHILLVSVLGVVVLYFIAIILYPNVPYFITVGAILTAIAYFYMALYIYYIYGYKTHKHLNDKFKITNFENEGKKVINKCNFQTAQEVGKYYLSQKLDYKNGYRWFFLTWFSAKTPIPVELQQYIDSRDKALINLFRPDPNAEDPLEKALFPLWAYIYWTLIGNDDAVREKYYQEAAKIGFDDTQWQLFYPKQLSAAA